MTLSEGVIKYKFCLNCNLPFERKWNKHLDPAFMDKECCCAKCEKQWARKENIRLGKRTPKHGVLA